MRKHDIPCSRLAPTTGGEAAELQEVRTVRDCTLTWVRCTGFDLGIDGRLAHGEHGALRIG